MIKNQNDKEKQTRFCCKVGDITKIIHASMYLCPIKKFWEKENAVLFSSGFPSLSRPQWVSRASGESSLSFWPPPLPLALPGLCLASARLYLASTWPLQPLGQSLGGL